MKKLFVAVACVVFCSGSFVQAMDPNDKEKMERMERELELKMRESELEARKRNARSKLPAMQGEQLEYLKACEEGNRDSCGQVAQFIGIFARQCRNFEREVFHLLDGNEETDDNISKLTTCIDNDIQANQAEKIRKKLIAQRRSNVERIREIMNEMGYSCDRNCKEEVKRADKARALQSCFTNADGFYQCVTRDLWFYKLRHFLRDKAEAASAFEEFKKASFELNDLRQRRNFRQRVDQAQGQQPAAQTPTQVPSANNSTSENNNTPVRLLCSPCGKLKSALFGKS